MISISFMIEYNLNPVYCRKLSRPLVYNNANSDSDRFLNTDNEIGMD